MTEDGRLAIHFPQQYSTCRDICDRPTNRERLEKALAEVVGKPIAIELKIHTKRPDSAISKNPSQTKRQQQVEITSEPFVQRALELFDGDQARIHYVPPKEKT